jgi:hypothetical protein
MKKRDRTQHPYDMTHTESPKPFPYHSRRAMTQMILRMPQWTRFLTMSASSRCLN